MVVPSEHPVDPVEGPRNADVADAPRAVGAHAGHRARRPVPVERGVPAPPLAPLLALREHPFDVAPVAPRGDEREALVVQEGERGERVHRSRARITGQGQLCELLAARAEFELRRLVEELLHAALQPRNEQEPAATLREAAELPAVVRGLVELVPARSQHALDLREQVLAARRDARDVFEQEQARGRGPRFEHHAHPVEHQVVQALVLVGAGFRFAQEPGEPGARGAPEDHIRRSFSREGPELCRGERRDVGAQRRRPGEVGEVGARCRIVVDSADDPESCADAEARKVSTRLLKPDRPATKPAEREQDGVLTLARG